MSGGVAASKSQFAAAALIIAVYANSLHNAFAFDDAHVIESNLAIRSLRNVPRFFADARTFSTLPSNQTYRPIVSTWLALCYWIGHGLNPVAFHAAQIVLLLATGLALHRVYRTVFDSARAPGIDDPSAASWPRWASLAAAALFCVHTANSETVNFISSCSEMLSGLGLLGALLLYIGARRSRRWHTYLLPMLVGMLAKTPAVVCAPLILFYRLLIEEQLGFAEWFDRRHRPTVVAAFRSAIPDLLIGIVAYVLIERMNPPGQTYGGGSRVMYLATETWVWLRYLRLFALPIGLSADTDLTVFTSVAQARVLLGAIAALATLVWMWHSARRRETRPVAFGIVWFWLGVLPSSSVFPLAEVTNDHRVFLPYMGLAAAAVWQVCVTVRARGGLAGQRTAARVLAGVAAIVIAAHAVATVKRNRVWATDESLWASVVSGSPGNVRGWMNYGLSQMKRGRYGVALGYFQRASALAPSYNVLEINMAIVTDALGDSSGARTHFQRALALAPSFAQSHLFYGRFLAQHGLADSAVDHLQQAVALAPNDAEAPHSLLAMFAARDDRAALAALTRQTLAVDPADPVASAWANGRVPLVPDSAGARGWFMTGLRFAAARDYADAAIAYRAAAGSEPGDADAWNNLGWSLDQLGWHDDAIVAYGQAVALRPDFERARNNLAAAERRRVQEEFQRAFALQSAGQPAAAVQIYRALVARYPDWVNVHFNLGHAWLAMGRCEDANREFARAAALRPDLADARKMLGLCRPTRPGGAE